MELIWMHRKLVQFIVIFTVQKSFPMHSNTHQYRDAAISRLLLSAIHRLCKQLSNGRRYRLHLLHHSMKSLVGATMDLKKDANADFAWSLNAASEWCHRIWLAFCGIGIKAIFKKKIPISNEITFQSISTKDNIVLIILIITLVDRMHLWHWVQSNGCLRLLSIRCR